MFLIKKLTSNFESFPNNVILKIALKTQMFSKLLWSHPKVFKALKISSEIASI